MQSVMAGPRVDRSRVDRSRPPLILLLHGVFFDRRMWSPLIDRLGSSVRVEALDLPGHGARVAEPFSMDLAVAQVRAAIAATGERPAAIVGLSLGGFVAMAAARAQPDITPLLVITGATREPRGFLSLPLRGLYRALALVPEPMARTVARGLVRLLTPAPVSSTLLRGGPYVSTGFRALLALQKDGFAAHLHEFPGSVLIVNGRRDPIARPNERRFLSAARHGALEIIPGVGHLAPVQAPDAFAGILRSRLDSASL